MTKLSEMTICSHCEKEMDGNFCSNCGRAKKPPRIDASYVLSEIGGIVNLEKGFLYTVKELSLRPGKSVKKFLEDDRVRLVKPINFVILSSLVYIIAQKYLGFSDGYIDYSGLGWGNAGIDLVMMWISNNYGFVNIIMAIFIAVWTRFFFKKCGYNYFENLILLLFLVGFQMLLFALFGVIESQFGLPIFDTISSIAIVYFCWGVGQFFDAKRIGSYFKALFGYVLGLISFIIAAIVFGSAMNLFM